MRSRYNELLFNYQLDRHCSKTKRLSGISRPQFNYQLDRHCSKTLSPQAMHLPAFSYQLDRHCSKTDDINGQEGQRCAVYFRGHDIAVVNLDKNVRVSLFRYKEGYSGYYTALWNKVHAGPDR